MTRKELKDFIMWHVNQDENVATMILEATFSFVYDLVEKNMDEDRMVEGRKLQVLLQKYKHSE